MGINREAKILKTGILTGIFNSKIAVSWADSKISCGNDDGELFDLSLSGGKIDRIIENLGTLSTDIDNSDIFRIFLNYYNSLLEKGKGIYFIEDGLIKLYQLDKDSYSEDEKIFFSRLINNSELRKQGLTGPINDNLKEEIADFLVNYKDYDYKIIQSIANMG